MDVATRSSAFVEMYTVGHKSLRALRKGPETGSLGLLPLPGSGKDLRSVKRINRSIVQGEDPLCVSAQRVFQGPGFFVHQERLEVSKKQQR